MAEADTRTGNLAPYGKASRFLLQHVPSARPYYYRLFPHPPQSRLAMYTMTIHKMSVFLQFIMIATFGRTVVGQAMSNVTCTTDLWTFNQLGQSPCLVAAALQVACAGATFNVAPLQPGKEYSGPSPGQASPCVCSTVTFSMISACGVCQSGSIASWSAYKANCPASQISISQYVNTFRFFPFGCLSLSSSFHFLGSRPFAIVLTLKTHSPCTRFPLTIPTNFSIPDWAYLNVSINGIFDPAAALNNHTNCKPLPFLGSPMTR
ncbi:hypothetical protein K439DRAFT_677871 [Ramaria rubella]|nr:hypothetical protein K439DRAFT_677871 [Ramaria rubella]